MEIFEALPGRAAACVRALVVKRGVAIIAMLVAVELLLFLPSFFAPVERVIIPSKLIYHDGGFAYNTRLDLKDAYPYRFVALNNLDARKFDIEVTENGRELDPERVRNEIVRNKGLGRHAYAPGAYVLFSASDNSDPRTNGRTYVAAIRSILASPIDSGVAIAKFVVALAIAAAILAQPFALAFLVNSGLAQPVGDFLDKIKKKNWRRYIVDERLLIFTVLVAIAAILLNQFYRPGIYWSDAFMWASMAEDFFGVIGTSDARHRPLFGFTAFLLNQVFNNPGLTWVVHNWLYFILLGVIAYKLCFLITKDKYISFFFSILPVTSAQTVLWLNHTIINMQGFFVMYASFWLLADYVYTDSTERSVKRRKYWLYSLAYGVLMLGKGHYNIALSLVVFSLLFDWKRVKETFGFFAIQFLVLISWALSLKFVFSSNYQIFEINKLPVSYVDSLIERYGSWELVIDFPAAVIRQGLVTLYDGVGVVVLVAVLISIGMFLRQKIGRFLCVYFFVSSGFLMFFNNLRAVHAGDLAIVGYVGIAIGLNTLRKNLIEWQKLFWVGFVSVLACWLWYNCSTNFEPAIFGADLRFERQ